MEGIEEKIGALEKWLKLEKEEDLKQFQAYLLPLSLALYQTFDYSCSLVQLLGIKGEMNKEKNGGGMKGKK